MSWSTLPCPVCAAQVANNDGHIEQHVTWHEGTRTLGPKRGDYGTAQGLRAGFAEMRRASVAVGTGPEASVLLVAPFGLVEDPDEDDELCGDGFVRPSGTIYCDLPAGHEGNHTAAGIGSWARG